MYKKGRSRMGAAFFYPRTQIATRQRQSEFIPAYWWLTCVRNFRTVSATPPAVSQPSELLQNKEMRYDP